MIVVSGPHLNSMILISHSVGITIGFRVSLCNTHVVLSLLQKLRLAFSSIVSLTHVALSQLAIGPVSVVTQPQTLPFISSSSCSLNLWKATPAFVLLNTLVDVFIVFVIHPIALSFPTHLVVFVTHLQTLPHISLTSIFCCSYFCDLLSNVSDISPSTVCDKFLLLFQAICSPIEARLNRPFFLFSAHPFHCRFLCQTCSFCWYSARLGCLYSSGSLSKRYCSLKIVMFPL